MVNAPFDVRRRSKCAALLHVNSHGFQDVNSGFGFTWVKGFSLLFLECFVANLEVGMTLTLAVFYSTVWRGFEYWMVLVFECNLVFLLLQTLTFVHKTADGFEPYWHLYEDTAPKKQDKCTGDYIPTAHRHTHTHTQVLCSSLWYRHTAPSPSLSLSLSLSNHLCGLFCVPMRFQASMLNSLRTLCYLGCVLLVSFNFSTLPSTPRWLQL